VLGLARLLADTTLDPVQRSYVDGIVSSADILLSVIGDVLDLSKIEAGRVELEATATELAPLVGRVAALFQGQAKAKGLSLSVLVQPSLPRYILADGSRLQQVLANLVGNAVKFTKAGSVEVAVNRLEGRLRFEVRDTGPGIAQGGLDSAFEAFHQASQEARLMGGSGLGLTIARSILQLMGGTIGAVSRVGEGSCFWFELPLIPAEPPTPNQPDAPTTDLKGVRVLLVEDNAVNVMVAGGLLRKAGCEYTVADDGARAVQMVEDQQFGAILMDVRMPGMDGLEATRRIRALERERRTPIIALTASALTDDREECFEAGMDDYLGKPFTEEALRATLSRWVSARACGFPAN
jgi:CheY-like chemotaxis protein